MKTNELNAALQSLSEQGAQQQRAVCRAAAEALEAALADLKKADTDCSFCAHSGNPVSCVDADCDCSICTEDCACKTCRDNSNWQWRGRR